MKVFKRISWFIKEEKWSYILGILCLTFIAILNLLPSRIVGIVIDEIVKGTLTHESLLMYTAATLFIAVIIYLARYGWRVFIFATSYRLERKIRLNLFRHLTRMSPSFFQEHRTGDLMAHATNDIRAIQRVASNGVLQFADAFIGGFTILAAMTFTISWKLTLFAVLPMPIMIIGSQKLGKLIHSKFMESQEAFSALNNRVHESISGIKVTKTFGQEQEEVIQFAKDSDDVLEKQMQVTKYDTLFDPLVMGVLIIIYIIVFSFGIYLIQNGELTTGLLTTFISYIHQLLWPMMALGFLFNNVERGNVALDRIEKIMNVKEDIVNHDLIQLESFEGDLEFNIKGFKYPDEKDSYAIEDLAFTLKEGQTLGVVGKTGSGKSTLLKLLLREYDDYEGYILYDNKNIKDINLHNLRQAIGYVPQENFLFSMTVEDNIRFGHPSASFDDVVKAAKTAGVHEDILGFEEGYQTLIGEKGVTLSGGQRQRVSIARALLLDSNILILDDSLSAVDAKTEELILEGLKENRKDSTTIILAHRLSALKHADLILVMDQGKVIERGNHASLIKDNGWYAMIFKQQEFAKEQEHHA